MSEAAVAASAAIEDKRMLLEQRMAEYAKEDVCVAFSGGVDSSLLLKAAVLAAGKTKKCVYAVTFDSRLHPSGDLEIAERVAGELGAGFTVLKIDELEQEEIRQNPVDRCYLCKRHLFSVLRAFAEERGVRLILDGTNEDDLHVFRPGVRALKELGIISPLSLLHITKAEVKQLAEAYQISVARRPSTPCLATRLPYGTEIRYEVLERIERGEAMLREWVGGNVRLRLHGEVARLEVDVDSFPALLGQRDRIVRQLKELGFRYIAMDIEGFRSGSMDEGS